MLFTPQVSGSHTSKSNRILAVGDSFFDIKATCYKEPAAKRIKFWPEIIAQELNMDIDIHGFSGCSNEHIFNKLLDYTNQKHYDLIIVNWTQLFRLTFEDGPFHISANYLPKNYRNKDMKWKKHTNPEGTIFSDASWITDIYQILFYETKHFWWKNIEKRTQRMIDSVHNIFPSSIQVFGPEPFEYAIVEEFQLHSEKIKFDIRNRKKISMRVAEWLTEQTKMQNIAKDKYYCSMTDGHPNTFANEELARTMLPKVKEVLK